MQDWLAALRQMTAHPQVHPLLKGGGTRLLFDKGIFTLNDTMAHLYFGLSAGQEPKQAAAWLEGFLHGSGLLLIHHPDLWRILDEWIADTPMEVFKTIVPLLRRTFAKFPAAERQKMLSLAARDTQPTVQGTDFQEFEKERIEMLLPALRRILEER
jgi:hypothetical protein